MEIIKIEKLYLTKNLESLKIDSPAPPKLKLGKKKTNLFSTRSYVGILRNGTFDQIFWNKKIINYPNFK